MLVRRSSLSQTSKQKALTNVSIDSSVSPDLRTALEALIADYEQSGYSSYLTVNIIKQLRALLVSHPCPPGAGSQPIASAPKDGKPVLLYGRFIEALSDASFWQIGLWFQGYSDRGWWTVSALPFQPTHWCALPAPPGTPSPVGSTTEEEKETAGLHGSMVRDDSKA